VDNSIRSQILEQTERPQRESNTKFLGPELPPEEGRSPEKQALPAPEARPAAPAIVDQGGPGKTEVDEADIERLMVAAEVAGRSTLADALARRLEALRAARTEPGFRPHLRVVG
jgi:hypothetical protein